MATVKKHKWIALLVLIAIVIVFSSVKTYLDTPTNLGPQLEYVGKANLGCEWWEVPLYAGFCSGPSYAYYFSTTLNKDELKVYFTKAKYIDRPGGGVAEKYRYSFLRFEPTNSNEIFILNYYDNTQAVIEIHKLRKTDKPYIISIADFDYQFAKSAL